MRYTNLRLLTYLLTFSISFATCQPGNRFEYTHVDRGLFKTLTQHPFFVIGSLKKYVRY